MANNLCSSKTAPSKEGKLIPHEQLLRKSSTAKKFVIGLLSSSGKEKRVPLTPEAVETLINLGHKVLVESNSGIESGYSDTNYSERGGLIVQKEEAYKSNIIIKTNPLSVEEVDKIKDNTIIISALSYNHDESYFRKLQKKKCDAIAYEMIMDNSGQFPILQMMSEINGINAIQIASELLSKSSNGKGILLGGVTGISPTEVVVFGATSTAESAIHAALGLGANVKLFDSSITKLREMKYKLGRAIFTSGFHVPALKRALKSAEVLIITSNTYNEKHEIFISEELIKTMKQGSVIIDLSMNTNSCIETSDFRHKEGETYTKFGVVHHCSMHVSSRVSRTSSIGLSNEILPILTNISDEGNIKNYLRNNMGARRGVYAYKGYITNNKIGNKFGIISKDIDLLIAAF